MQTALQVKQQVSCTQFYLTTNTITKLNTFKLTPTAKLVLLYLTTCYNPKHKEVFPKQKTIAIKLGVSEISVTRAISELHKEGLIISERKISNRYVFTSRIVSERPDILIDDKQQIDSKENIKLIDSYIHEQKKETNKEQTLKSGENVSYSGDDLIIYEYAKTKAKYSVEGFIRKLKESGGDKTVIKEFRRKQNRIIARQNEYAEQQRILSEWNDFTKQVTAESCGCSLKDILNKKRPVV